MNSKLIEKFFRGECSPEEVEEILGWFGREELDPSQEQDLNRFWQEAEKEKEDKESVQDAAKILAGINKEIDSQKKGAEMAPLPRKEESDPATIQAGQWKWILKAVAAVLLPICFLYLFTSYFSAGKSTVSQIIAMEAMPGTRETISLEDGSKITLNAGSSISYQKQFAAHNREITLHGEAFFEVAKDSLRPFIVRTGNLSTQALGTSFNIRYRSDEHDISVALATGAVKIEEEAKGGSKHVARLEPGQQLIFDQTDQGYKVSTYDLMEVLTWRDGILYFKKANLGQVVKKLESWYGVEIQITGKVSGKEREWLYTGAYDNQSLDNVLEGRSFVKYFSYEMKGNKVILKFN